MGKEGKGLRISIAGRHISITEAIKDYAREKAEKFEKYFEGITNVQVKLVVEGLQHNAEMIVAAAGGATIIASAGSTDMYSAIDIVTDKIERQLKKHKARLHRRR
jgi:putative sigma-54 modulation protein